MVKIEIEGRKEHTWGPGMAFIDEDGDLHIVTTEGNVVCLSGPETRAWVWGRESDAKRLQERRGYSLFPVAELKSQCRRGRTSACATCYRKGRGATRKVGLHCHVCGSSEELC